MTPGLPSALRDPFLWLLLALHLVAHLPGITDPPLNDHSWRQADTAAVIRNFSEEDSNLLYPRVDARGEHVGITGMEFPLFNHLVHQVNDAVGFSHATGRPVNVVLTLLGILYLFLLAHLRHGTAVARAAGAAFLTSPLFFFNARQLQPDAWMVSLCLGALFHAARYARDNTRVDLWVGTALLGLAMLVKVTAVFVCIPILWLLWEHRRFQLETVVAAALMAGAPTAAWYVHSMHLSADHGLAGHFNLTEDPGMLLQPSYWLHVFVLRIPSSLATLPAAALAAMGAWTAWNRRDGLLLSWVASVVLYQGVFAAKTYYHVYYSLPFTAPLALLAALGLHAVLERLPRRRAALLAGLALGVVLHTGVRVRGWYALHHTELLRLETFLQGVVPMDARVVVNGGPSPSMVYFSHRKGWTTVNASLTAAYLTDKAARGARFVVVGRHMEATALGVVPRPACVVKEDDDFLVVSLEGDCGSALP